MAAKKRNNAFGYDKRDKSVKNIPCHTYESRNINNDERSQEIKNRLVSINRINLQCKVITRMPTFAINLGFYFSNKFLIFNTCKISKNKLHNEKAYPIIFSYWSPILFL